MINPLIQSVAVALLSLSRAEEPPEVLQFECEVCGKKYISSFVGKNVRLAPNWDEDEENPPVSARKAMKLAKKTRDSVVKIPNGFRWKLHNAELTPISGSWVWLVNYRAVPDEGEGKEPNIITIFVMMDETVFPPQPADGNAPIRRPD